MSDRPIKKRMLDTASCSESGKEANLPPPEASNATLLKPGPDNLPWIKTGLLHEYLPILGDNEYSCPFPKCLYTPCQKLDLVCTHIRMHLNISIGCHYCTKGYWSTEGWKRHCRSIHPDLPKVPTGAEEPEPFKNPLGDDPEIMDIEQEEAEAINQAIKSGKTSRSLAVEPEFLEELEEIPDSSTTTCTTVATSTTTVSTATPMDT